MSPVLKIFVGALMMVLGIFTSIEFSNQLLTLVLGGVGPLLILVGAFIVWLESDEWKVQRQEQKQEKETRFNGQQTLQEQETTDTSASDMETETREAAKEIKQAVSRNNQRKEKLGPEELVANRTVSEVKEAVQDRQDLSVEEVLEAERNNQNRKTLINYLERRVD